MKEGERAGVMGGGGTRTSRAGVLISQCAFAFTRVFLLVPDFGSRYHRLYMLRSPAFGFAVRLNVLCCGGVNSEFRPLVGIVALTLLVSSVSG